MGAHGSKWKAPRWLHTLPFTDLLKRDATVCLLTLLVALCRSEQLTADGDEKCWKHRPWVRGVAMCIRGKLCSLHGDIWTSALNLNAASRTIMREGKGLT